MERVFKALAAVEMTISRVESFAIFEKLVFPNNFENSKSSSGTYEGPLLKVKNS